MIRPPDVRYLRRADRTLIEPDVKMKPACGILLAILLLSPVHAEWARKDYASEYENCVPPCQKNNPRDQDKCLGYCRCVTDDMQTQFADHDLLMREVLEQKLPDRIAGLQKIANTCNKQVWGNPARKLKF